jgi:hypothetical protein
MGCSGNINSTQSRTDMNFTNEEEQYMISILVEVPYKYSAQLLDLIAKKRQAEQPAANAPIEPTQPLV